jgi:Asp-tRNA(Asn)/Glu-tRNA(Gln) amidotransferase A subunit family amidase
MTSISSQLVYTSLSEVAALAAAKETEAQIRSGNYRGPLHGVPLAVKDIYEAGPSRSLIATQPPFQRQALNTTVTAPPTTPSPLASLWYQIPQ